jgi:hypothetical protein
MRMHLEKILNMIRETESNITDFIKIFSTERKYPTSFEDWDSKDVIFHINSWIGFAEKKLRDIQSDLEPDNISDINGFNVANYNRTMNNSMEMARKSMEITIDEFLNVVSAFSETELFSKSFPTGFSFELWRYIVMDGYIHPNMHLMQYYIESGYYQKFIDLVLKSKDNYLWFAGDDIGVFFFGEFFNNDKERKECFERFQKSNIEMDDFMKRIIQINT